MVTHSNILAWEIPWTEEPGRLQSVRSMTQQLNNNRNVLLTLGRNRTVKCLTLIVSLLGHKCVSSHRKQRYRNLGISCWCIRNHGVWSLQEQQVTCPFPRGLCQVNFLYCWPCSSKSSSPSVVCISVSPSDPHQIFYLKSKKFPPNVETT